VATELIVHRIAPRVHGEWTRRWWAGDAALTAFLGTAPSPDAFDDAARRIDRRRPAEGWAALLRPSVRAPLVDALVVLAGQQPVFAGGPALTAHKAATAIRLAALLAERWRRPVLPVFLLATEDHDSGEVDHVDHISMSNNTLIRTRCRIQPGADCFHRSHWDGAVFPDSIRKIAALSIPDSRDVAARLIRAATLGPAAEGFSSHVGNLLLAAFASSEPGLMTVQAHELTARVSALLVRALQESRDLARSLAGGAERARAAGIQPSFDADDPRPLLLESSHGRRRRLDAGDTQAASRLHATPADFSPHAALRPIVQAATLPVVAQVCGPSELAYLGQARGLHALFGVEAPVLVPRLEATRVPEEVLRAAGGALADVPLDGADAAPDVAEHAALSEAAQAFVEFISAADPSLRGRAERFLARTRRDARRLAEALAWRGRTVHRTPPGRSQHLRPRGRPQDTVLAWLPDAWADGDPARWGRRIVGLARPLDPPAHVLYTTRSGAS
jgi:hypothetical protein